MSFRSKPVVLGATDTDIYEVPVTLSAVVVLGIHNVVPSPVPSFTLKFYKQSTDTTTTLGTITFGSEPSIKYAVPFSMEPGDKIIGSASVASSVVVTPFITDNAAIPTAVGFDPIGVWNSGTTYGRNDIVRVEGVASPYVPGKTYISLQENNQNQDPATETAYWMVLTEDGPQGPIGGGDMLSTENLGDVDDPPTAFANIKQPGSESSSGVFEKATDAEVRAATADKAITADRIESASAYVELSDAATVLVDWDAGINFSLTAAGNRTIGNPTNGQPGTYRSIIVQGDDATDRTITFGNQYLGNLPTIADCDSTKWYELTIKCITASHFIVTSHVAKKP